MADHEYVVVAALDLGTTFSGYGFSYRNKPESIFLNKNWASSQGFQSYKTPTSILTDGEGGFLDMGYDAEMTYNDHLEGLKDPGSADLHLYRHFKMLLHNSQDVTENAEVEALDGTRMSAVKIFGYAISYLRKHLLGSIQKQMAVELSLSQIFWVITVPAIWSEQSKKFMKQAAKLGGCMDDLDSSNVILALEPEAASLCCRRLNVALYSAPDSIAFPDGTKYLVLDCGGGTVDLTAHQVESFNKVEEILPADGGPWGGTHVDKQFKDLLKDIFGSDFLNHFMRSMPQDWFRLISSFEDVKKTFDNTNKRPLRVLLPYGMFSKFQLLHDGKQLQTAIEEYNDSNVKFQNGYLVVNSERARAFFEPAVKEIVALVRDKLSHKALWDCKYIFMVGGFSESLYLQDEIRNNFEIHSKQSPAVLVPGEAQLAIIKGAVLFGNFTDEIIARVARRTYGFDTFDIFDPKIHNPTHKGGNKCYDIFEVLVEKGQRIPMGHELKHMNYPVDDDQTSVTKTFFALNGKPKQPVQYVNDVDVEKVGSVSANFPEMADYDRKHKTVKITVRFDSTEIKVSVIHCITGDAVTSSLNFLSG